MPPYIVPSTKFVIDTASGATPGLYASCSSTEHVVNTQAGTRTEVDVDGLRQRSMVSDGHEASIAPSGVKTNSPTPPGAWPLSVATSARSGTDHSLMAPDPGHSDWPVASSVPSAGEKATEVT